MPVKNKDTTSMAMPVAYLVTSVADDAADIEGRASVATTTPTETIITEACVR